MNVKKIAGIAKSKDMDNRKVLGFMSQDLYLLNKEQLMDLVKELDYAAYTHVEAKEYNAIITEAANEWFLRTNE